MVGRGALSSSPALDHAARLPFFMYTSHALDHGWLRHCAGFEGLRRSAYNERLAEVYIRDALASHPWRTMNAELAKIVYVPLWEVVSFNIGECNGTTHESRMATAAAALKASPLFANSGGTSLTAGSSGPTTSTGGSSSGSPSARRPRRKAGFVHLLVSTGCIEKGKRLIERLSRPLSMLLRASIVGRDRAYSPFYASSAVGRCTIEVPYVANPYARLTHARTLRRNASSDAAVPATPLRPNATSIASAKTHTPLARRRRFLLSFMGSLDVCCEPGLSIRRAMRRFIELGVNESTMVVHVAREAGRPLPGKTPEEQHARYRAAGELMANSRFCLIPAGDNEVSSRLYSAMAAGCVPVVVANQLSGAFASRVPYGRFWLRVEQQTFISQPLQLLARLRAIPSTDVAERRSRMLRYVADVTYNQPLDLGLSARQGSPSRAASNLLVAAHEGCLVGTKTQVTGVYPSTHKYAADDRWGLNCSCTKAPPRFFWGPPHSASLAVRQKLWTRGRVPTEVCRCLHCATLCPLPGVTGHEH